MNRPLKTYSRKKLLLRPCNANADRLTSLPDELLCRILSMLSLKDAAATLVLSKRMTKAFSWISSFDLDDSPISHCLECPHLIERFPLFESFVDSLFMKLSPPSDTNLTRFRLHFGGEIDTHIQMQSDPIHFRCQPMCFPDVLPARLYAWISYPLSHGGLKELDLSFHVRRPYQCKLPPTLFACQSLELLRLSSNLEINNSELPLISLPNLKLLYLSSFVLKDDDFVTRLVSSCPVLEDLTIDRCLWMIGDRVSFSSHSLRSLVLIVLKHERAKCESIDLFLLDTPDLRYLHFFGYLVTCYSIAPMNALVKAFVCIDGDSIDLTELSLVKALSHVPELALLGSLTETLYFAKELRDQLPMFPYLRTLELSCMLEGRWDILLLLILHRSPSLEILVFPEGLFACLLSCGAFVEEAAIEAEGWRTAHPIPSCCCTHLKRIVFKRCLGTAREINTIKFLLAKSFVLEELVLHLSPDYLGDEFDHPDLDRFEDTVKDLPRASSSCLITLQR